MHIEPVRIVMAVAVAALGVVPRLSAQPPVGDTTDVGPALQAVQRDVAFLSADLLEGRAPGAPGEELAANYIADRFAGIGLRPAGSADSWLQPFAFRYAANPHAPQEEQDELQARNVIGVLDRGAGVWVVVGAHYDHLGWGGPGSLAPGDAAIHNGADDNASGVAALLETARRLAASDAGGPNVVFVAFSAEEAGLHGSKAFVADPPVPLDRVTFMLNYDMVGRLAEDETLAVNGSGTSPAWAEMLNRAERATGLRLTRHESGLGPSDHASFYLEDLPVLHLFTGQHADYHAPSDDSHLINYPGLLRVAELGAYLVNAVDSEIRVAFTPTQDESQDNVMSFEVSLGIMPDYVFDGEGLRVDAVLEGGAAAAAGLEDGDVILRLGDAEVTDVYAYMEALGQFAPGDTAMVLVIRDGEPLERTVRF